MDEFLEKIKSELVNSFMQIPNKMAKIFDKNLLSNFKTEEGKIGDQNEKDDLIEESVDSIFSSSYDSSNEQKKIEKIETVKKRVKKKSCY
jgi:hypothetical protein